ncbi:MAG TPA: dTDP-4-dehydrorhamnose reductase [Lachnospiraceae bacterium]|nr:dTDP-4-dehydrorhamnose reductase [Lachnospiraceae bacterium]HPF30019.1 dTDP-4-dehydrorhamnose reductase [Lachnospiraceae bacterium]
MKKIIVTGCNGQLGKAINQVYAGSTEYQLINTDVAELDITDVEAVLAFAEKEAPYAIINCAAHTNVNACETQRELAYRINAIGPRNLSIAAKRNHARLVHISTDYVFPGNGTRPYSEFDSVGPMSMYGSTKLAGERFVEQFAENYFIIRTAWLYGDGKNFVKTMLKLSETNDSIGVVDDQIGSPTSALELARAIYALLPTNNFGLFHGTCEGICSWADFTEEIFSLAGRTTKVEHISTREYDTRFPGSAPRPAYSVLDNEMFRLTSEIQFKDWKDALKEYMDSGVWKN